MIISVIFEFFIVFININIFKNIYSINKNKTIKIPNLFLNVFNNFFKKNISHIFTKIMILEDRGLPKKFSIVF